MGAVLPFSNQRPLWLIQDVAADGSPRWFVRLSFSDFAIGEPSYFGPFCHEATAREFETKAYNTMMDAVTECGNIASDLHAAEVKQPDGEPNWLLLAQPKVVE